MQTGLFLETEFSNLLNCDDHTLLSRAWLILEAATHILTNTTNADELYGGKGWLDNIELIGDRDMFDMGMWGFCEDPDEPGETIVADTVAEVRCGTPCCLLGHVICMAPEGSIPDESIDLMSGDWILEFNEEAIGGDDDLFGGNLSSDPTENAIRVLCFFADGKPMLFYERPATRTFRRIPREDLLADLNWLQTRVQAKLHGGALKL